MLLIFSKNIFPASYKRTRLQIVWRTLKHNLSTLQTRCDFNRTYFFLFYTGYDFTSNFNRRVLCSPITIVIYFAVIQIDTIFDWSKHDWPNIAQNRLSFVMVYRCLQFYKKKTAQTYLTGLTSHSNQWEPLGQYFGFSIIRHLINVVQL